MILRTSLHFAMHPFFLTITMRAVYQIKRTPEFPFNMPSPGFSLRLKEKSGLGELSRKNKALVQICNPVGTEAPGWCTTEVPPAPSPGFCSNLWYHTAGPNRIPTIPTLGCVSSWFHVANWKPLEEIHIGIQTPEHLAKPSPDRKSVV